MLSISRFSSSSAGAIIARCKTVRDLENRSPDHRLNNDVSRMAGNYDKTAKKYQGNSLAASSGKGFTPNLGPDCQLREYGDARYLVILLNFADVAQLPFVGGGEVAGLLAAPFF
jgi:hypothetical protein